MTFRNARQLSSPPSPTWRAFVLATCAGNRRLLETCASPELLAEYDRVLLAATETRSVPRNRWFFTRDHIHHVAAVGPDSIVKVRLRSVVKLSEQC